MKAVLAALMLALVLTPAAPSLAASCGQSARLGHDLILVGDSDRRVIQAEPDRVVRLETEEGGAAGYRYEFYLRSVTVQVYTRAGRVVRVCRVRE